MNRKRIIAMTVLGIIIIGLFIFQWFIQKEFKKYPPLLEMVFSNEGLYYSDLLEQKEYLKEKYMVSFAKESEASYKRDSFNVMGIDENYLNLLPLNTITGNEPDQRKPQALISKQFAEKHFIEGGPMGKSLELFGKSYEVVGIYKISNLEDISGIDKKIIYVPYKELPENGENTLNKILFGEMNGKNVLFFREKLQEYISSKIPDIELNKLNIYDYMDSPSVISQFFYGLIFVGELLLFSFITVTLIKKIKTYKRCYKEELQINYGYEIFSKNLTDILFEMIIMTLLIFLWIFLIRFLISFKFEIPGRVLPADDIFDFKFFFSLYSSFKPSNAVSCYGQLYKGLLKISGINFTVSAIVLIIFL